MNSFTGATVAAMLLCLPTLAAGQSRDGDSSRAEGASALFVETGVAGDASHTGFWLGGSFLWQATRRLGVAGSGVLVDQGPGASAFEADLTVELGLASRASRVMPYVRLGVGAYRAWFDAPARGQVGVLRDMPEFYRRRLRDDFRGGRAVFMDPSFIAGFGVDIPVGRHVSVRPDARMLWVYRDGHSHLMALAGMRIGYRLEHHPVTPARIRQP